MRAPHDGEIVKFYMSDSQGNGWEGASATIFDCDGTYLANVTLEDLDSETVWLCLPGASDYGRLKVNVSSGDDFG